MDLATAQADLEKPWAGTDDAARFPVDAWLRRHRSCSDVGCAGRAGADADARARKAVRLVTVESSTVADLTTYSAVIAPNAQVSPAFRVSGYSLMSAERKAPTGERGRWSPALRFREDCSGSDSGQGLSGGRRQAQGSRDESSAALWGEARSPRRRRVSRKPNSISDGSPRSGNRKASRSPRTTPARRDSTRLGRKWTRRSHRCWCRQRATAAAAQLQEASIALGDTELRAPFDAVLLERNVDVGTLVSPGRPAFTIADLHLVKARFSVPDTALHIFRAGQPLQLTVDAFSEERFQGQVLSVAPAADRVTIVEDYCCDRQSGPDAAIGNELRRGSSVTKIVRPTLP